MASWQAEGEGLARFRVSNSGLLPYLYKISTTDEGRNDACSCAIHSWRS